MDSLLGLAFSSRGRLEGMSRFKPRRWFVPEMYTIFGNKWPNALLFTLWLQLVRSDFLTSYCCGFHYSGFHLSVYITTNCILGFFFFYSFLHVTNAERGQARLRLNGPRSCLGEEDDNYTHEMTGGSNFQTFFLFQQWQAIRQQAEMVFS